MPSGTDIFSRFGTSVPVRPGRMRFTPMYWYSKSVTAFTDAMMQSSHISGDLDFLHGLSCPNR